jgi:hypothetical protein
MPSAQLRNLPEIFETCIRLQMQGRMAGAFRPKGWTQRAELMRVNFGEVLEIEDLGNHSALTVIRLGLLLAGTVNVTPDPKRKDFYEIEDARTFYYIYVSPVTGTISLIAAWRNIVQPGPHGDVALAAGP